MCFCERVPRVASFLGVGFCERVPSVASFFCVGTHECVPNIVSYDALVIILYNNFVSLSVTMQVHESFCHKNPAKTVFTCSHACGLVFGSLLLQQASVNT